jgi:hypothetical protein
MTRTELMRLIKKLHHRRKMIAEVREMEERLSAYLAKYNLTELRIRPYKVTLDEDGELTIIEAPLIDERQLEFQETQNIFVLERR